MKKLLLIFAVIFLRFSFSFGQNEVGENYANNSQNKNIPFEYFYEEGMNVIDIFEGAGQGPVDDITNALKNGDASALSAYFHATIDLTILQKQGTYSKSQAEQIVQNFFTDNKPSGFKVDHNNTTNEGSKYIIGTLTTTTGEYRVYVYFKNLNGSELIQTLRFELDE